MPYLLPEVMNKADKSIKCMNLKESDTLCNVYLRQAKEVCSLSHGDTLLNCAYTCFLEANNAITHI